MDVHDVRAEQALVANWSRPLGIPQMQAVWVAITAPELAGGLDLAHGVLERDQPGLGQRDAHLTGRPGSASSSRCTRLESSRRMACEVKCGSARGGAK